MNIVPTTARPPTASGSALATKPLKTNSSRIMLSGTAMSSAFLRSSCTWLVTWRKTSAKPVTRTSSSWVVRPKRGDSVFKTSF